MSCAVGPPRLSPRYVNPPLIKTSTNPTLPRSLPTLVSGRNLGTRKSASRLGLEVVRKGVDSGTVHCPETNGFISA